MLGYDVNLGITLHFVDWVEALRNIWDDQLDIMVVTLNKEQNPGLLEKLKNISIPTVVIDKNEDLEKLNIWRESDIVHCHGVRQTLEILKIRNRHKLPFKIVVTMHAFRHGYWYRPFYTNIVSLLYLNRVDMLHFVSQTSKKEFLKFNLLYKKINASTVFPLGCASERFIANENIKHFDFYDKLISNDKNIVYLADLIPRKNHIWLINTLSDLLIQENAKLWLFGSGTHDEVIKIKRLIKEKNLNDYVFLPGRVDGKYIPSILKKMRVAVCTSKSETMGHVIMEPMFAGVPVVTLDVGIASSIIRDFTTGFIIKGKSETENFKRAIRFLLKNDIVSKEIGQNAKLFAEKWLTWNITALNCLILYKSLTLSY